jgi:hypothetical protein
VVGNKPYAYVLNKADLCDLSQEKIIRSKLEKEGYAPCFFTTLKDNSDKTAKTVIYFFFKLRKLKRFSSSLIKN